MESDVRWDARKSTTTRDDELGVIDLRFRTVLERLDAAGRLSKINTRLDPHLEVGSFMHQHDGDRGMYFAAPTGHTVPVAANLLVSGENVQAIFQRDVEGVRSVFERALGRTIKPVTVGSGPCQEVVHESDIDLGAQFPILKYAPNDAGRYISAGVVVARDARSGVSNASFHRLLLTGPDQMAIKLDYGRHLRRLVEEAQEDGRKLPIAIVLGPDLSLIYAAGTMGAQMPFEADEFEMASSLLGEPLPVVQCKTVDLTVPAEAEIVIEGEIDPEVMVDEAPFIEFLGLYAARGPAPVVNVSAVTHRERPIYHAILGRETTMLRKYVMETAILRTLRAAAPIVTDIELTNGGLNRFHLIIQVHKNSQNDEGYQRNAMLAAVSALKDLDLLITVDDDIDIRDWADVEYALATRFDASTDMIVIPGVKGHEYVAENGITTKLGLDATVPFDRRERYERVAFAPLDEARIDVTAEPGLDLL